MTKNDELEINTKEELIEFIRHAERIESFGSEYGIIDGEFTSRLDVFSVDFVTSILDEADKEYTLKYYDYDDNIVEVKYEDVVDGCTEWVIIIKT